MEQLGSHWTDFHQILYLSIFLNTLEKIQVSIKIGQEEQVLNMKSITFFIVSRSFCLRMRNVSEKSCRDN
jgi:hypothetical protein